MDGRIKALRAALGPAGKQIRTVFKVGYKLEGSMGRIRRLFKGRFQCFQPSGLG